MILEETWERSPIILKMLNAVMAVSEPKELQLVVER
jgi:hypothetical protein